MSAPTTAELTARVDDLQRRVESAHRVSDHLAEVVRSLSAQGASAIAIASAVQTENARLARTLDGPPSVPERLATLETRTAPMSQHTPPQDAISALWSAILSGVVAPFKAYASARTATQVIVAVLALFFGLLLTDGGRDVLRSLFPAPVTINVNPAPGEPDDSPGAPAPDAP